MEGKRGHEWAEEDKGRRHIGVMGLLEVIDGNERDRYIEMSTEM